MRYRASSRQPLRLTRTGQQRTRRGCRHLRRSPLCRTIGRDVPPRGHPMKIAKAVITAAGPRQRTLPLQTLVDRDGVQKSVLRIVLEEAQRAGVEDICVVVNPEDEASYARAAGNTTARLTFVPQSQPRGYGDAILCARPFTGDEAFLHLVGDHLWVSARQRGVRAAARGSCRAGSLRRQRGAGVARDPAALLRHGRRPAAGRTAGPVPGRRRDGEADAHGGRAASPRAGSANRSLPLLLWSARPHARGDGYSGRPGRPGRTMG